MTAHWILALQSIVSRNVPALESAVVIVAAVAAGNIKGKNVTPGGATLCGTVRTLSESIQEQVITRMRKIIDGVAAAFEVNIELDYRKGFPATVNDAEYAALVARVATELFGAEHVMDNYPSSMGSEDFSVMLKRRPGAYFRLGQQGAEKRHGLHNASYNFNDAAIPYGSAMFCGIVERFLPLKG